MWNDSSALGTDPSKLRQARQWEVEVGRESLWLQTAPHLMTGHLEETRCVGRGTRKVPLEHQRANVHRKEALSQIRKLRQHGWKIWGAGKERFQERRKWWTLATWPDTSHPAVLFQCMFWPRQAEVGPKSLRFCKLQVRIRFRSQWKGGCKVEKEEVPDLFGGLRP